MADSFREIDSITFRNLVTFVTGFGVMADEPFNIGSPTTTNSILNTYNQIIPYGGISGYMPLTPPIKLFLTGYPSPSPFFEIIVFPTGGGLNAGVMYLGDQTSASLTIESFYNSAPNLGNISINSSTFSISCDDNIIFTDAYPDGFFSVNDGQIYIGDFVADVNNTYLKIDDVNQLILINSPTINFSNPSIFQDNNNKNFLSISSTQRLLSNLSGNTTIDFNSQTLTGNWKVGSLNSSTGLTISGFNVITTNQTGNFISSYSSAWTNLTCATTTVWTTATNVFEDRKILALTGSSILSISGLYNGWEGILEVIQSGSGFNLTLPSGTKVPYNGSGSIILTTGISGAIDMLSFAYNGTTLFANIANRWT